MAANTNTFQEKSHFEAYKNLIRVRSIKKEDVLDDFDDEDEVPSKNVWQQKPINFSPRVYQPKPPKRNSRDAVKPWTYDRYLRVREDDNDNMEPRNEEIIQLGINNYLSEENESDSSEGSSSSSSFQASFRLMTAKGARAKASKSMGFRDSLGLGQYKNPQPHDFRGVYINGSF
jgi:hypothetical protein